MNVRIGEGQGIRPLLDVGGTTPLSELKDGPGRGVLDQSGEVGDATPAPATLQMALAAFIPMAMGNFEAKLADITSRLGEMNGEVSKDRLLNEQETKRLNMQENQAKLEASEEKMENALISGKVADVFNTISMVAQGVSAAILLVAGGVLAATGVGSGAGVGLMLAGGLMAASLVNTLVQSETGNGVAGHIVKGMFPDADEGVLMAVDIAATVYLVAASIATIALSGGASLMGVAAQIGTAATSIVGGVAMAGSSTAGIVGAVNTNEAQQMQADTKDIEAFMQQLDDIIDQAMQMLMEATQRFNAVMSSVTDMMKENADATSSTRFAV